MIKNLIWFALGSVTVAILTWTYFDNSDENLPSISAPPLLSDLQRLESIESPSISASASENLETPANTLDLNPDGTTIDLAEDFNDSLDASRRQFADSLQSTPEEIVRVERESVQTLEMNPDRHQRFESDAASQSPRLRAVENVVTNELWRNIDGFFPINADVECYAVGCRLKLHFSTNEELVNAANGLLPVRMLVAVDEYDFGAAEKKLDSGEFDPEVSPDVPAQALDVFLWPKGSQRLQSIQSFSQV